MNDETKYSLITARDPSAEGRFFYAVKTTKIFCRPTCKARLARRHNVEFFDTTAQAQEAGYRPCKRCLPLLATYHPEADKIKKACDFLNALPEGAPLPGLERLAKEVGLTKHHFHRLFKRETGVTPRDYALARRRASLSETSASTTTRISTPSSNVDFQTPLIANDFELSNADFSYTGGSPLLLEDFKFPSSQEVRQILVYHTLIPSSHGTTLVAFCDRRVCKIEFGSCEQELIAILERDYPSLFHVHLNVDAACEAERQEFQRQAHEIVDRLEDRGSTYVDPLLIPEAEGREVLSLDDELLNIL
jgi:methylphosphotriester-DNA--protein-cysteine methyltransferase